MRGGAGDEHGRRDDHGERGPPLVRVGLAGLLGGHLGHLGVFRGRVAEAVEHAARDPEHGCPGHDGAGDEDTRDPGQPVRPAALIDVALAQEGSERREVDQSEGGQGEHYPGDAQDRPRPCSQVSLTEPRRCSTMPGTQEQSRLDQAVADYVDGGAWRGPAALNRAMPTRNSASVADRGERQQSLDVPFAEAVQRADHGRQHARAPGTRARSPTGTRAPGRRPTSRRARSRTGRARPLRRRTGRRPA